MDNWYILALLVKKKLNITNFINWYNTFFHLHLSHPNYSNYLNNINSFKDSYYHDYNNHIYLRCDDYWDFGDNVLNEFEFNYLVSYFSLIGVL